MRKWIVLALCVVMALAIVSCNSSASDPAVKDGTFNIAENYDMEGPEGQKVLFSDHFRMKIPADLDVYELGVDQPEYSQLVFYYVPAKLDGYEGTLFTLKAYDMDDESYKELENYVEAGTGENKRYIVSYPPEQTYGAEHAKRYHDFAEFFKGLDPASGEEDFITFTQ